MITTFTRAELKALRYAHNEAIANAEWDGNYDLAEALTAAFKKLGIK